MNKTELVRQVAAKSGVSQSASEKMIQATQDVIEEALARGESVAWRDFGSFKVSQRVARKGSHPQTGAPIDIPAQTTVRFVVAGAIKDRLN